MANDYCTLAALKAALDTTGVQFGSIDYDAFLTACITRASRMIDGVTKWEPGAFSVSTETTRYFDGSGTSKQSVDPICATPSALAVSVSGVISSTADYTAYSSSDWNVYPYNSIAQWQPAYEIHLDILNGSRDVFYAYPKSVLVTCKFGYAASDTDEECQVDDVVNATITQASRLFKRAQQSYQDAGAVEALSQLRYVRQLDPDVELVVNYLTRVLF